MSNIAREVIPVNIEDELKRCYMDYAMSVIISRALPDVRDGLKPVERRILVAMNDLHVGPTTQHRKSAKMAGEVMGNYHPHGDAAIYMCMVRMAQDFNSRYRLIDGQGNMGSIDGDPPAAMRYTEMRMSYFAVEMLDDLEKDTVDWADNYDQTRMEPMVLPAKYPNLLANGTLGIAVGMATKIPPHNLSELVDGFTHLVDNPDATVDDLMQHIKGPDFPTSGMILGTKGIKSAYETGRGQIIMQAQTNIEMMENGKSAIVVTELPYQVNKSVLIEKIAAMARDKKIDGITGIPDYSDRHGIRIQIELRRDAHPKKVLNYLYKHTDLRKTFGVIMLALVDNTPRVLTLKQMMQHYIDHRVEIVVRRTKFDLQQALRRAHILEGLRIAIEFLDEIIQIIRKSSNAEEARNKLMVRFAFSQIQADAILNMQLRQLTALEQDKIETEFKDLLRRIASLEDLLSDPIKILNVIKAELKYIKDKFGDERKTRIVPLEANEIGDEDMIPDELTIITITRDGYIKRVPIDTYRSQKRGGRGIIGANTKEEDTVKHLFVATTHHYILFFTDRGRVYRLKAYEIPQTTRHAMGTAIINLISIEPGDKITATIPVRDMDKDAYMVMATEMGEVKKTDLNYFHNMRANGLRAFDIEEGDSLRWVAMSNGADEITLVTSKGMSIRFSENNLRAAGRAAGGVRGIRLRSGDKVVGMTLAQDDCELLVATENGYGKRTPLSAYKKQTRGGTGIITMNLSEKTGRIVETAVVDDTDKIVIITSQGIMIKIRVKEIRSCGRSTQGVRLINLGAGATVASLARIPKAQDPDEILELLPKAPMSLGDNGDADAVDIDMDVDDIEEELEEEGDLTEEE
ncbi:MAG: DNA gyrase subunit A [Armatimonadetes bacterium]|nr:DNA gyrase subunit A [Armatimonadota bacterium]